MKTKHVFRMGMLLALPLFFTACSKEETNDLAVTESENTTSQRIVGGSPIDPVPIKFWDVGGKEGYRDYEGLWQINPASNGAFCTKVINSWNDIYTNFNGALDITYWIFQDIDFSKNTAIVTWLSCPNQYPTISKKLVNYYNEYELTYNISYGSAVMPAFDNRTHIIVVPKTNVNIRTVVTYGNGNGGSLPIQLY